jgi:hypothetical protein
MQSDTRTKLITLLKKLRNLEGHGRVPKVRIDKLLTLLGDGEELPSNFTWKEFERIAGYTSSKKLEFKPWDSVFEYCGDLHDPELNREYVRRMVGW